MTTWTQCLPLTGRPKRRLPWVHSQATPRPMNTARISPLYMPPPAPARTPPVCDSSQPRLRQGGRFVAQQVADTPLGVDESRTERVELAAQVAYVGLHDLGLAPLAPAPHHLEQLCPGEDQSLVPHQAGEQPELGWGQVHLLAAMVHRPSFLVEDEIACAQHGARGRRYAARGPRS